MRGNGDPGAADLLANKGEAAGRIRHARGLLTAGVLGLMLACGTAAHASEPASPATTPQNQVHRPSEDTVASPAVGDLIFDGGIAFLIIVMAAFFAISFLDSKDKDEE